MKKLLISFFVLFPFLTKSQSVDQNYDFYYPLANGITIGKDGKVASDLVYQGQKLTVRESIKLKKLWWDGQIDLSNLDPEEFTYWSNEFNRSQNDEDINLNENDTVEYLRPGSLDGGESSIHVLHDEKIYELMMSELNYRSLMMEVLLSKIGYYIPKLKKLNRVKVEFKSEEEKKSFLDHYNWIHNLDLELDEPEGKDEWLSEDKWIHYNPENKNWVILRDIVVRDISDEDFTNLALEPFEEPEIQNKRSLNSLLIPYSILNYSGSTNAFEWWAGRVVSQNIYVDYPSAPQFEMSFDDGRWMLRRLSKLKESDWREVIKASELPGAIQKVLLEKTLARFNSLVSVFQLDLPHYKVNYKPNLGVDLKDGKLLTCKWTGYALSFCDMDKENPIGRTDLWEFIKSKAFSVALDSVMSVINSIPFLNKDIAQANSDQITSIVESALERFEQTGQEENVLMKKWSFNYHNYNLIFSRNLVTGRFQGNDQLVSLVDSVGVELGVGKYFARMGYNEFLTKENLYQRAGNFLGLNVNPLSLKVGGSVSRVYSHITPITSIKEANKQLPFKESIVPFVKGKLGRTFNKTKDSNKDGIISRDELTEIAKEELKSFKAKLKLGESFLITDRLGAGANAQVSGSYKKIADLSIGGGASGTVINRLHITRATPNQLHVYKNFGNLARVTFNAQLASLSIPLTRVYLEKIPGGKAKTQFFSISLDEESPKIIENVLAIRSLMVAGSLRPLKKLMKPVTLKYKYDQSLKKIGVFWFNFNSVKSNNNIEIISPDNDKKTFFRVYDAKSNGKNLANYGAEVLEYLVRQNANFDVSLLGTPLNPGLSITGKSKNQQTVYELELDNDNNVLEQFAHYTYSRNGWEADREKMEKLVSELELKYKYDYFLENPAHDTNRVRVYHLAADFYIYNRGIEHMFSLDDEKLKKIFSLHSQEYAKTEKVDSDSFVRVMRAYKANKKRYFKFLEQKKWKKLGKMVSKTIRLFTENVTLNGLSRVWGGSENFYTYASLNGFREGVEQKGMNFESSVQSNSFGTLGQFFELAPRNFNDNRGVPLSMLENSMYASKWGLTKGELYLNWILGRIY